MSNDLAEGSFGQARPLVQSAFDIRATLTLRAPKGAAQAWTEPNKGAGAFGAGQQNDGLRMRPGPLGLVG